VSLQLGIDIGGTFTDAVAIRDEAVWTAKVPTRRDDHAGAVADAIAAVLGASSTALGDVDRLAHGTTIATNAILQEQGARIGILATRGFEDTLYIGRLKRSSMYDLFTDAETPGFLCPRRRVRGVPERLGPDGTVVEPLDEGAVLAAGRELVDAGVESVAVCLLHSYRNPEHEQRVAELLGEVHPELDVSLSSRVDPRFREYERLVVTAFDAYVKPLMRRYLSGLGRRLRDDGARVGLEVMESHGGVLDSAAVAERPVGTLLSGLAAGVVGARAVGESLGIRDLITLDMGGTSADVALIAGDKPLLTSEGRIGRHPVRQPMIDVVTIGAGGGSIAAVDAGGNLRVGPGSAGSDPGPAAYGLGGEEATVTDANLVLGLLGDDGLAGGALPLRAEPAERALAERVAEPLGLDLVQAAWGVRRVVCANMADAIQLVSVQRGHDARRFALVASGGAGPLHACDVAALLGIDRVLVPAHPGVLSAYGLLAADRQAQEWRTFRARMSELDGAALDGVVAGLERQCRERVAPDGRPVGVTVTADMRYVGQSHELAVPVGAGEPATQLAERFHAIHERLYGQHDPGGETEITGVRVMVAVRSGAGVPAREPRAGQVGERQVWTAARGRFEPVPVIARDALRDPLTGPAIVAQEDTTTLVAEGWRASELQPRGTLLLERTRPR
jgi:N-methylhydantoinase A